MNDPFAAPAQPAASVQPPAAAPVPAAVPPAAAVPLPAPVASDAVPLPPPPGVEFYGAQAAWPPPPVLPATFKRRWGVTMGRWGISMGVTFAASMVLALVGGMADADPIGATGYIGGTIFALAFMYLAPFPWWIDHLVARAGAVVAWSVHGGASLVFALFGTLVAAGANEQSLPGSYYVAPWLVMVMWALAYPGSMLLAGVVRGSYPPRAR